MRKKAWPKLVAVNRFNLSQHPIAEEKQEHTENDVKEEEILMIKRDIPRSVLIQHCNASSSRATSPLSVAASVSATGMRSQEVLMKDLLNVITSLIHQNNESDSDDKIFYYQGFHDIASIILLSLQEPGLSVAVLKQLATFHLQDAMKSDFNSLTSALRGLLYSLLQYFDQELYYFLLDVGMNEDEMISIILPWLITWFSHDLHSLEVVSRLFDAFIASHPILPL
mmetsp:Transcript_3191/g.4790  ORF Transcript_3191/g.4790 Transcript_3191/m.4790 type:complete len:225 (-) Transcript_3191:11-685(-)